MLIMMSGPNQSDELGMHDSDDASIFLKTGHYKLLY